MSTKVAECSGWVARRESNANLVRSAKECFALGLHGYLNNLLMCVLVLSLSSTAVLLRLWESVSHTNFLIFTKT